MNTLENIIAERVEKVIGSDLVNKELLSILSSIEKKMIPHMDNEGKEIFKEYDTVLGKLMSNNEIISYKQALIDTHNSPSIFIENKEKTGSETNYKSA